MASVGASCLECGQSTVPGARFCAYCGTELVPTAEIGSFVPQARKPVEQHSSEPSSMAVEAKIAERPPPRGYVVDGAHQRSQRPTGILFAGFGAIALLLGIAGIFLLRQWAVLFMAFGLAFLVVGVRKIRTPIVPDPGK
ncbi:MAG TPA: hypothetical protein VGB18_06815 [Candidatus Thermoplasmatota archaeon]